jgi:diguanylate cyclase (GGDEF)-like protein
MVDFKKGINFIGMILLARWRFKASCMLVLLSFSLQAENGVDNAYVINNYLQLQNLIHLQGDKHKPLISELINQVNTPQYAFLKPAVLANLAVLNINEGYKVKGNKYLADAVRAFKVTPYNKYTNSALYKMSRAYLLIGQYPKSIEYTNLMNSYALQSNDKKMEIRALLSLGLIYDELQLYDLAETPLNKSLEKAISLGDKKLEQLSLLYLVGIKIYQPDSDHRNTLKLLNRAKSIYESIGYLERLEGLTYAKLGENKTAEKKLLYSLGLAVNNKDLRLNQITNQSLAEFYLSQNEISLALLHAKNSLEVAVELEHKTQISGLNYLLAQIYKKSGDDENTLKYMLAYVEFQNSNQAKAFVEMLYEMDKSIENIAIEKKLALLENENLLNQIAIQKSEKYNQFFLFIIILISVFSVVLLLLWAYRNKMMLEKINYSMRDNLTGCHIRSYLSDYLPALKSRFDRHVKNGSDSIGVVIIDCDNFKPINDNHGHAAGDEVLKAIVIDISNKLRDSDILIRWGGDEFVLICENISLAELDKLSCRIKESVANLCVLFDGHEISITVSSGYALHDFSCVFDFDMLLKCADKFLYKSKSQGGNFCTGGLCKSNITP